MAPRGVSFKPSLPGSDDNDRQIYESQTDPLSLYGWPGSDSSIYTDSELIAQLAIYAIFGAILCCGISVPSGLVYPPVEGVSFWKRKLVKRWLLVWVIGLFFVVSLGLKAATAGVLYTGQSVGWSYRYTEPVWDLFWNLGEVGLFFVLFKVVQLIKREDNGSSGDRKWKLKSLKFLHLFYFLWTAFFVVTFVHTYHSFKIAESAIDNFKYSLPAGSDPEKHVWAVGDRDWSMLMSSKQIAKFIDKGTTSYRTINGTDTNTPTYFRATDGYDDSLKGGFERVMDRFQPREYSSWYMGSVDRIHVIRSDLVRSALSICLIAVLAWHTFRLRSLAKSLSANSVVPKYVCPPSLPSFQPQDKANLPQTIKWILALALPSLFLSSLYNLVITAAFILPNHHAIHNIAAWDLWFLASQVPFTRDQVYDTSDPLMDKVTAFLDSRKGKEDEYYVLREINWIDGYKRTFDGFPIMAAVLKPFGVAMAVCVVYMISMKLAKEKGLVDEDGESIRDAEMERVETRDTAETRKVEATAVVEERRYIR
ncbi:hypothetical protein BJ508DRAFT_301499 [Ascobolus immersus RN42]|uniref:Uncharacterized protein n=1 Tax=Ascobolus immersus RN42 TaxID=1160509 RepID=A0A3N4IR30_ASCIM|nr:hypothetical protein BJ508DRAFT_301499 [Ascobolus immersus RN42]